MEKIELDGLSPIELKTFGKFIMLREKFLDDYLEKIMQWNRHDLFDRIDKKIKNLGPNEKDADGRRLADTWENVVNHQRNRLSKHLGKDGSVASAKAPPLKPTAIPDHLIIHRRSVIAFLLAQPGHAFTAVVKLEDPPKRPKIFLFPAQQTTHQSGQTSEGYAVRKHEDPSTGVYKARIAGAIEHKVSGGLVLYETKKSEDKIEFYKFGKLENASHLQLVNMIRLKAAYSKFLQGDAHFVGFTVSKGDPDGNILFGNKYSMTSLGSNAPTFWGKDAAAEHNEYRPYPSTEWSVAIQAACDNLLYLEHDLRNNARLRKGIHPQELVITYCNELGIGEAKVNKRWEATKNMYWPDGRPRGIVPAAAASSTVDTMLAAARGGGDDDDDDDDDDGKWA